MKCSILIAFNDSSTSRRAIDSLIRIANCPEQSEVTMLHVFRKPDGSEALMGKKFMEGAPKKVKEAMENARQQLIEAGFHPDRVHAKFVDAPYPTVADGIIDEFGKSNYNLVVIGRKRMSKAEEFVLGDTSIKLVRALEGTAVLVVKQ